MRFFNAASEARDPSCPARGQEPMYLLFVFLGVLAASTNAQRMIQLARAGGLGRVQLDVEGVLVDPLGCAVEHRDAVVAGVGADVAGQFADVAGQRGQQEDGPVLVVVVEELVGTHADGEERGAGLARELARQVLHGLRRGPGQLLGGAGVEVGSLLLHHV